MFGCLVVWEIGCLVVWEIGRLVVWEIGRLVVWEIGCLGVWVIGRLVVWGVGGLGSAPNVAPKGIPSLLGRARVGLRHRNVGPVGPVRPVRRQQLTCQLTRLLVNLSTRQLTHQLQS